MPIQDIETAGNQQPALRSAFKAFVEKNWFAVFAASGLLLIPCFWHREIVSSDLGSHLYNAWLVQLIHRGEVHGLWIAPLHTNVLFDLLLSALGSIFRLETDEKIAVSFSVLTFFWGAFSLIAAAARRPPWFLAPAIAMVTYGWTFHLGLFNYYLSLGFSFFGVAIAWRGKGLERLAALALAPLILVAHPLGFIWFLAASAYIWIHEHTRAAGRIVLFLSAAAFLGLLHLFFWRYFQVAAGSRPFYSFNGADQLVLFGERYRILARVFLAFAIASLSIDIIRPGHENTLWKKYSVPLELYALTGAGVLLLPGAVGSALTTAPIALLTERLTSVSAVLGFCLLGVMRLSRWHFVGFAAVAVIFFSFVYRDTAIVNKMESQIDRLVRTIPSNSRVLATLEPPPGSRILLHHLIDRACIGRCFSYGNYEPGAAVFRVRATPGNPYVLDSYDEAIDVQNGGYIVQPRDLPVYQVYQCSETGTDLCIRPLTAGEENDRLGVHPDN